MQINMVIFYHTFKYFTTLKLTKLSPYILCNISNAIKTRYKINAVFTKILVAFRYLKAHDNLQVANFGQVEAVR